MTYQLGATHASRIDTTRLPHYGVPHSVLAGTDKRFTPVRNLFIARMTQEWLRHLNVSYWNRAMGYFDPVAGHWKKLAWNTIQEKKALIENNQHTSYTHEGQ